MTVERVTINTDPLPAYDPVEPGVAPRMEAAAEIYAAIVLGTRDYVQKNGFRSVILGLSGGIDSALTAVVARDALGAERVHVVGMPSRYSSEGSVTDSEDLAKRAGLQWSVVPIGPVVEAYDAQLAGTAGCTGWPRRTFRPGSAASSSWRCPTSTATSCSRPATRASWPPASRRCTATPGGYAPIKDVAKTWVYELCRWRNRVARERGETEPIPEAIITKAPSAELAPGQRDEDRLPPYSQLDALLDDYVGRDLGREQLIAAGHDAAVVEDVIRLVDVAEYKRRQYPPGPKITLKAFGRDRRLPITSHWRERG